LLAPLLGSHMVDFLQTMQNMPGSKYHKATFDKLCKIEKKEENLDYSNIFLTLYFRMQDLFTLLLIQYKPDQEDYGGFLR
jgi:hypothetical protein